MAQFLTSERFGNGSDGALTISGNTTESPTDSSCSGTSGTTSLSATNASFAANQIILIHQSRGTGAGAWELNVISSYVAGTITTTYALSNTYTDSGASQAQVRVLNQYSSATINSGITYTTKAWDANVGGILAVLCNGTITVTGTISANAKGYLGGTGDAGGGEVQQVREVELMEPLLLPQQYLEEEEDREVTILQMDLKTVVSGGVLYY